MSKTSIPASQQRIKKLHNIINNGWNIDQLQNETILVLIGKVANDLSKTVPHTGVILSRFSKSEKRDIPINEMSIVHKLNCLRIFLRDNDYPVWANSEYLFQLVSFLADDIAVNITN